MRVNVFWFRRDLRLEDNTGLYEVLQQELPVLPIFIFDENILSDLPRDDARLTFIHESLVGLDDKLKTKSSGLQCFHGEPLTIWKQLLEDHDIANVYYNKDYEPYAKAREKRVSDFLNSKGIGFNGFKDQVIFEESEVVKPDGKPYSIYTPYKRKWLAHFTPDHVANRPSEKSDNFLKEKGKIPSIKDLGFQQSNIRVREFHLRDLQKYGDTRDFPSQDSTSYLSPHLRFGIVNPRQIIRQLGEGTEVFLSELIWREFFMQILFHYPRVILESFRAQYDNIEWRNDEVEFEKWCNGQTGYPMVDAGMRQLNETGYMHNRVRMVVASFLCKHLLIDWRWGEAYFAEKLLDYDLSANNGNWQWAAGTGCDAAPYFRVFNPSAQLKRFDGQLEYVKRWIPEVNTADYPLPMVEHTAARNRALEVYKEGLKER